MVKRVALDTNTAIGLLNNEKKVLDIIKKFDTICLPVIVCGELIFGARNSGLSEKNEKKYLAFIESCELLDINMIVAGTYADIRLKLKKEGRPIPENDIWIAATCIVNNTPIFTFDKHFRFISEVEIL
jgi:tRNA(fMet)-specific endonuclease VapC